MSNQLTLLSSRDNHYDNMVRMYTGCAVVLENLEITYTLEHQDLSFLQVFIAHQSSHPFRLKLTANRLADNSPV